MPDTGESPYGVFTPGGATDVSGGGEDPSYAWSLAPGGSFPGADQNYLGYRQGDPYGNPGYKPGYLSSLLSHTRLGPLISGMTANAQSPGAGQAPGDPTTSGGYPYQGWSGPGAAYGPITGPTRGLIDQGRPPGTAYDGPETKPSISGEGGGTTKKGGNKRPTQHFSFTPYQAIQVHPQFVDWQPSNPGDPSTPTRFVSGSGSSTPATPAPAAQKPGKGPGKPGKGGSGGKGSPAGPGGQAPAGTGGAGGKPGLGQPPMGARQPVGAPATSVPPGTSPYGTQQIRARDGKPDFTAGTYGGVDTNYIDYRTPSWLRDPTTGILNTSGMPDPTPFAPDSPAYQQSMGGPNQQFDAYVTALHDRGLGTDDIMSLVGPYGYQQDGKGGWTWGWGSGPVVSNGPHGGNYSFASQAPGGGGGGGGGKGQEGLDSLVTSAAFFHGTDV